MADNSKKQDGNWLFGRQFNEQSGIGIKFRQLMDAIKPKSSSDYVENDRAEVTPKDDQNSLVKLYQTADEFYDDNIDFCVPIPTYENLNGVLPLTLLSVTVDWNEGGVDGEDAHPAATIAEFAPHGSIAVSGRARATGGATVMPTVTPDIQEPNAENVQVMTYSFYTKGSLDHVGARGRVTRFVVTGRAVTITLATPGIFSLTAHGFSNNDEVTLTGADLPTPLAQDTIYFVVNKTTDTFQLSLTSGGGAIATSIINSGTYLVRAAVKKWPRFRAKKSVVKMYGVQVSVQANAELEASLSYDGTNTSKHAEGGDGESTEVSLTTRTETWPACVHETITPTGDLTKTRTASADVEVHTPDLFIGASVIVAAQTHNPGPVTHDAVGTVGISNLTATDLPAIPSSGLYLLDIAQASSDFGAPFILTKVVNFADLV